MSFNWYRDINGVNPCTFFASMLAPHSNKHRTYIYVHISFRASVLEQCFFISSVASIFAPAIIKYCSTLMSALSHAHINRVFDQTDLLFQY